MKRWIEPAIVVAVTSLLLFLTAQQGYVRDEGYYFKAAQLYQDWFDLLLRGAWDEAFHAGTLEKHFSYNFEHPGFIKILMAWSYGLFHETLGWFGVATSMRLPAIFVTSLGLSLAWCFARDLGGRTAAWVAWLLLLSSPRVFHHAHLACFDAPVMALVAATAYAFWRSIADTRWAMASSLLFGLALATKHNAVFAFVAMALAWIVAWMTRSQQGGAVWRIRIPWSFMLMAVAAPLLLYVWYPLGWYDPWTRLGDYYRFHLRHEHYPVDYFGRLLWLPPFPMSYPWVMSALTIPVPLLVLGLIGGCASAGRVLQDLGARIRLRLQRPLADVLADTLLLSSFFVPIALISLPNVPIFGGTKHWMTCMPILALWAGQVWVQVWRDQRALWVRGLWIAVLAWGVLETARTYPHGLTYYNTLAGGHRGAAAMGLPRTYWGGGGRSLLPLLNQLAGPRATVFTDRMNWDAFRTYQRDGLIRADLRFVPRVDDADWALINHQREYAHLEREVWRRNQSRIAVSRVVFDDVPIVSLFRMNIGGHSTDAR